MTASADRSKKGRPLSGLTRWMKRTKRLSVSDRTYVSSTLDGKEEGCREEGIEEEGFGGGLTLVDSATRLNIVNLKL